MHPANKTKGNDQMKKNFIETADIITAVSGNGEGTAVYSNRTSEICGIIDTDNIFTPLADIKEMVIDYIHETESFLPLNLQHVYSDDGKFHGFIIQHSTEKGE